MNLRLEFIKLSLDPATFSIQILLMFLSSLSINALRACVYIYIQQLSSFRALTLWFIDLIVATCQIQETYVKNIFHGQNTKILEVRHFCMLGKWPPTVIRRAKH